MALRDGSWKIDISDNSLLPWMLADAPGPVFDLGSRVITHRTGWITVVTGVRWSTPDDCWVYALGGVDVWYMANELQDGWGGKA